MEKKTKSGLAKLKVWQLIVALVVVVFGTTLFVGAVSGWFGETKVSLDVEYYCGETCDGEYAELTSEEYENMVKAEKSFIVFVDQGGCTTADRMREYVVKYALEKGIKVYRMMFSNMKETSLHTNVKYYPSVVVISKGRIMNWLKADSDDDAEKYNNYDSFKEWAEGIIK